LLGGLVIYKRLRREDSQKTSILETGDDRRI